MNHSFNVELAQKYGIVEAILIENIAFWINKNKANDTNFYDGHTWTYNSARAFAELFPYLSKRQVDVALQRLQDAYVINIGNYNKLKMDRTKWYTIIAPEICSSYLLNANVENVKCISQKMEMQITKNGNAFGEFVTPIPDINTDINTVINADISVAKAKTPAKKFIKPSLSDIKSYVIAEKLLVNAEKFHAYYESNGWKAGRNPMKDWQSAVRYWHTNDKNNKTTELDEPKFEFLSRNQRPDYVPPPPMTAEEQAYEDNLPF